jgi:sugar phosphate isomerase/epimerase
MLRDVVSNICIKNMSQIQFACILKLFGIKNVQIAPTTLIKDWNDIDNIDLSVFTKNDINVYSFQSITYGLNDLNIFDKNTNNLLLQHLKKVVDCGIKNNIKVLVFGCPRNRKIINDDNHCNNNEIFCDFFRELGEYIGDNKLTICIEPNSKEYGCNYINTIEEAGNLVRKINQKNIKMMVDIGNAIMEKDDLTKMYECKDIIYNIDVANEKMLPFTDISESHKHFKKILKDIDYNKNTNLEMLINSQNDEEELKILVKSIYNYIKYLE